jgi:multidrug transporter EmrE-like cation transporter
MTARLLAILLTSITLGAVGQLMLRQVARVLTAPSQVGLWRWLLSVFTSPTILAAFVLFAVSALLWIAALRETPLTVAYPMVALSYIIIFVGSYFLFAEPITLTKLLGAVLVVAGIIVIHLGR